MLVRAGKLTAVRRTDLNVTWCCFKNKTKPNQFLPKLSQNPFPLQRLATPPRNPGAVRELTAGSLGAAQPGPLMTGTKSAQGHKSHREAALEAADARTLACYVALCRGNGGRTMEAPAPGSQASLEGAAEPLLPRPICSFLGAVFTPQKPLELGGNGFS